MTHKRKKLLVHRQIQRALMRRAAFYFFTCMLFILLPASLLRTAQQPERLLTEHVVNVLQDYAPIFISVVALMPFALYDMLKMSHRMVGPVIRLRNEMERMAAGEVIDPIVLRQRDYWHDLASIFNDLVHDRSQIEAAREEAESERG